MSVYYSKSMLALCGRLSIYLELDFCNTYLLLSNIFFTLSLSRNYSVVCFNYVFLVFSLVSFSIFIALHLCLDLISCNAFIVSFWKWNLFITMLAFGNDFLTMSYILPPIYKIASLTYFLCFNGILWSIFITAFIFFYHSYGSSIPSFCFFIRKNCV